MLIEKFRNVCIIFTGTKKDRKRIDGITDNIHEKTKVINAAGETTLRELIELIAAADMLITVDSGPGHLASLTGTKTIVLMGPDAPHVNAPIGKNITPIYLGLSCSPCITPFNGKQSNCVNNICMKKITPTDVFNAAERMLKG